MFHISHKNGQLRQTKHLTKSKTKKKFLFTLMYTNIYISITFSNSIQSNSILKSFILLFDRKNKNGYEECLRYQVSQQIKMKFVSPPEFVI